MKVRTLYENRGHTLEFVPVDRTPGYSHRVVVDGKPVDWMACKSVCREKLIPHANKSAAAFFLQKHFPE